jgi:hypothetical protein
LDYFKSLKTSSLRSTQFAVLPQIAPLGAKSNVQDINQV